MSDPDRMQSFISKLRKLKKEFEDIILDLEEELRKHSSKDKKDDTEDFEMSAQEDTSKENTEEPGGEEETAPDTEFHTILKKAGTLADLIKENNYPVFKEYYAFVDKIETIIKTVDKEEADSDKACKVVTDIIGFYDRIFSDYCTDGFWEARKNIESALGVYIDFLKNREYSIIPDDCVMGEKYSKPDHGGSVKQLFSRHDEGTILSVSRHGIAGHGNSEKECEYVVSKNTDDPGVLTINKCYEILMEYYFRMGSHKKGSSDIKKVKSWIFALPEDDVSLESSSIYLRQVLNIFSGIEPQPKIIKKTIDQILSVLKSKGFSQITVTLGVEFDRSFNASKYERRYVASDKPKDTIVKIIQYGLVDTSGVPLQKAVVGLSRG